MTKESQEQLRRLKLRDKVDPLVYDLTKPLYVLRMARANERTMPGASTRAHNARKQVDRIVRRYVRDRE